MKRNALTEARAKAIKAPGRYCDGNGLWLQVGPTGGKSWLHRYMLDGKARAAGLGPYPLVSLKEARQKLLENQRKLLDKVDPLQERQEAAQKRKLAAASTITFRACATAYIKAHEAGWRNDKHRAQWGNTLETYVYPALGDLPIAAVDTGLVMQVLEPIWHDKPETASRVRGRIESVLDWATARGYRQGDNPARWRGHIQNLLPAKTKVREVEHHKAVPYAELGDFMVALRQREGVAARALEFVILTATRSGDVRGARWGDIDLGNKVWTVPRTKTGKPHKVPLSDAALALLATLPREGEYVFIGSRAGKPLSDMSLLAVMKRMGRDEKPHGFRSTFSDWCAEQTAYPSEVREMALAHTVSDKVEAAYRRGDMFAKRARLMADWARFCASPSAKGEVVALRAG
jgi:integrase